MSDGQDIIKHPSYNQVVLDVDRCAGRLEGQIYHHCDGHPPKQDQDDSTSSLASTDDEKEYIKKSLTEMIVRLLIKKPGLHYYQGFHDVCLTYIVLLGDIERAEQKLDVMVDSHFKIHMQPTMVETQDYLAQIPIIIGLQEPKVQEFFERVEVGTIFALSWVITWFSHVVSNQCDIEKIFAFLEDHDPHMVLYLSAALVLQKKNDILKLEPEMSTVHHYLSQLPRKEAFEFDKLFTDAVKAFKKWPPTIVKKKLEDSRRIKMYELHNFNLIKSLAHRLFEPYWSRFVSNNPRTTYLLRTVASPLSPFVNNFSVTNPRSAIIVMVLASALLFQYDRWAR